MSKLWFQAIKENCKFQSKISQDVSFLKAKFQLNKNATLKKMRFTYYLITWLINYSQKFSDLGIRGIKFSLRFTLHYDFLGDHPILIPWLWGQGCADAKMHRFHNFSGKEDCLEQRRKKIFFDNNEKVFICILFAFYLLAYESVWIISFYKSGETRKFSLIKSLTNINCI